MTSFGFCRKCGKPCVGELTGEFDTGDGEPLMRPVCSSDPCKHQGHRWGEPYLLKAFLGFGQWFTPCTRCGAVARGKVQD